MTNSFEKYREYFPHLKDQVYLDHASVSPLSTLVTLAIEKYLKKRNTGNIVDSDELFTFLEKLRGQLAKLVKAESAKNIAFVQSTTVGLNILAHGLKLQKGDRILLTDCEFPANVFPFLNLQKDGIMVDFVKNKNGRIPLEDVLSNIKPETKLVSLSLVEFFSGFRHDAEKIGAFCREKGIVFALDAIQALGAVAADVQKWKVDFLSAGGQKWLMSPMGTGFIYIAPHLLDKLEIVNLGWLGMKDAWNFFDYTIRPLDSAAKFEQGSFPFVALEGFMPAVKMFNSIDQTELENRIRSLSGYLIEKLTEHDFDVFTPQNPKERAGIVLFTSNHNNEEIHQKLKEKRITISLRENHLRISPHFYNNENDLDILIQALLQLK